MRGPHASLGEPSKNAAIEFAAPPKAKQALDQERAANGRLGL
jgi:hypothetical protein